MEQKTYVRIANGVVAEPPIGPAFGESGEYIPIEKRFTPDIVETLVDITNISPVPQERWTFQEGRFSSPAPRVLTLEEVTGIRDGLIAIAGARIAPLQDAVDLDIANDKERALLALWKRHRVDLNRLDLSASPVVWPEMPS